MPGTSYLQQGRNLKKPEIFTTKIFLIAGVKFRLDDMEHGILRKYRWKYNNRIYKQSKLDDWTIIFSQQKEKYKNWIVNNKIIKPEIIGQVELIKITRRITTLELVN